ncbi:hypothetical protein H4CHR_02892 [Variovorax sp. PBS-H4]|uniref:hypothetical protein n=1 Tax=Variovorax sp. PBS-H4 TaxID=434008 RepID=UPI0013188A3D|nr:hypothetical protein [Variovorax sp. PBS-H4]VTU31853.1 hypothetical protein H4CHR_02892 [Variovorax sp. PBS-H4]
MAKVNPNSQASKIRRAKALLEGLLRAPKTRAGLIAAARTKGVTRNFLYGWLSNAVRTGEVVMHKSTEPPTFQLAATAASENPSSGEYPMWLEPRGLPAFSARTAFIDGERQGKKSKPAKEPECDFSSTATAT